MRGALIEATLPVVMRRTCVCPSHLLSAAVKCFVMWYLDKSKSSPSESTVSNGCGGEMKTDESTTDPDFPDWTNLCHFEYLFILISVWSRSLMTAN